MKIFIISIVLIISSLSHGSNLPVSEYALLSAELTEVDPMGNGVVGSPEYILTLNMREGLTNHASSFTLCQKSMRGEGDNCLVFWVTKPREQLRCNIVRYTAEPRESEGATLVGNIPKLLLVDQSSPKSSCHQNGTKGLWEVYLFSDKPLPTALRGFPEVE